MKGDADQISIFDLLNIETPEIPLEEQKKGRKGWIIELSAIRCVENGFKEDEVCVCTRPVVFVEDTEERKDGWWQRVETTYGPIYGWAASPRRIYAKRPTWNECVQFALDQKYPGKITYMEVTGNWEHIYGYENGYRKGA